MSDGIFDDAEDVVGVLTERIESHFGMGMGELRAAVGAAPTANPEATGLLRWHALLLQAQSVLDRAEGDLLAALETQPGEDDDPTMRLAHRVNEAVTVRDGRALVIARLLDTDAPGAQGLAAQAPARVRGPGTGPAVQTSAPRRPPTATGPAPKGRAAR